jgi:Domain of unknown function (DUF6089)
MRKLIVTLSTVLLLCLTNKSQAQYLEVGGMAGGTSYYGDLQKFKPEIGSFGPTVALMARWNRSQRMAFRASAMYGSFNASDYRTLGHLRSRNLEAQTQLYELSVAAEYNLLPYDVMDGKTNAPYFFMGVGGLYFNPQARYQGKFIDLQPLGTEGQLLEGGKKYSPLQVVIPLGIGIKLALWQRLTVGFEFGIRQTFTDYLDDVGGKYPNLDALEKQNPIAAAMSYKGAILTNPTQRIAIEGQKRGDTYRFDRYYFAGLSMTYSLAGPHKMEYNTSYRNFFNFNK